MTVDRGITWFYVLGTSVFIFFIFITLKITLARFRQNQKLEKEIMEEIIKTDDKILNIKQEQNL